VMDNSDILWVLWTIVLSGSFHVAIFIVLTTVRSLFSAVRFLVAT